MSKTLSEEMCLSTAEMSKSLHRSRDSGLLYWTDLEKRVNRSGLLEFLAHGLRYVFPAEKGALVRGIATAMAAPPLNSRFVNDGEPPLVWPYPQGDTRGISFVPLYDSAPRAALADAKFYELLALCDAIRGGKARERNMAIDFLKKAIIV